MAKAVICTLLALALVMAGPPLVRYVETQIVAWQSSQGDMPSRQAAQAPSYTQQLASSGARDTLETTLYYRFAQTGTLGAQRATLDLRRDETVASLIVSQLIEGPVASHDKLSGLFPQGTRLLSATGDGSTAFVTLSSAFLGRPDGAPGDWEDIAVWQEEAALRRKLAVQSIVLSLTEDGRYQRVQLYVADSDDDLPQRISMYWFNWSDQTLTEASSVLGPCGRDETFLLTPRRALTMIMEAWQRSDWDALYALLSQGNEAMPSLSAFEAQMREIDEALLSYEVSEGTVSFDGQSATLVLDAQLRSAEGGDAQIIRESVPLTRVMDNWTMTIPTLLSLMIRD